MIQLSIIIPVYKVELYVGTTLQSIVDQRQDVFEYEVIVVDDGTPDNSMQVVESFMEALPQMSIIHQKNKGLSGARNTGLKHATGKYVWFVDSDDTLADNCFESIAPVLQGRQSDVFGFNVAVYKNGVLLHIEKPYYKRKHEKYVDTTVRGVDLGTITATGLAQRYVFRRDFLRQKGLCFKEGIIHEDVEFIVKVICLAETFTLKSIIIYNYMRRESGSIMTSLSMKSVNSYCAILESWDDFSKHFHKNDIRRRLIAGKSFKRTCGLLAMHKKIPSIEYSEFYCANRWKYTARGIKYYWHSSHKCTLKQILKLFLLLINPKWNMYLK